MGLTRLTEEHGNELFPGGMLGGVFPGPCSCIFWLPFYLDGFGSLSDLFP
jgi:hypothetical protein